MNISFSGCGFAGTYHIGVVTCLREHAPQFVANLQTVAGASAGSLAALMLASGMSTESAIEVTLTSSQRAQSLWLRHFNPFFDLIGEIETALASCVPDDAHILTSGRLCISLTSCRNFKNVRVSRFESKKDLIQAVLASCYIPVWARVSPVKFRGKYFMDGGLSDNQPQDFSGETITVSPFSGETDICPTVPGDLDLIFHVANTSFCLLRSNIAMAKHALVLPDSLTLAELARLGYNNCLQFLQCRGLDECSCEPSSCQPLDSWEKLIPETLHYLVDRAPRPVGAAGRSSWEHDDQQKSSGCAVSRLFSPLISGLLSTISTPLKKLAILEPDDSYL